MTKKLLSLLLTLAVVIGTFSGLCLMSVNAASEEVNLLENYGMNPSLNDEHYSGAYPYSGGGNVSLCTDDSQDGDDRCVLVTGRTSNVTPRKDFASIVLAQNSTYSRYRFSFWVKCKNEGETVLLYPTLQVVWGNKYSTDNVADGTSYGNWNLISTSQYTKDSPAEVGNEWVYFTFTTSSIAINRGSLTLSQCMPYCTQKDFVAGENNYDLLMDNFSMVRIDKNPVLSGFDLEAEGTRVNPDDVLRNRRTGIGAIYYSNWVTTANNYWEKTNATLNSNDRQSSQDARCLSPDKYHYMAPFFSKITSNSTPDIVNGSTNHIEFVYNEDTWKQEMAYAAYAGIDFMAYLGTISYSFNAAPFNYHVKNKGKIKYNPSTGAYDPNGTEFTMKACIMLQDVATQDVEKYILAMKEDYYYKIDGMPVVYFYNNESTPSSKVKSDVDVIRYKAALAGIENIYFIQMGYNGTSTALKNAAKEAITVGGADAIGWYSSSPSGANATYSSLAAGMLNNESAIATAVGSTGSITTCANLGRNQKPRIDSPVTWIKSNPYGGAYSKDPTTTEIKNHLLDVLYYNKVSNFKANTVLMYAWNEFTEGGWICPTLNVDSNGALVNSNPNTQHLEAVKSAISTYRQYEKYYNIHVNASGTLKKTPSIYNGTYYSGTTTSLSTIESNPTGYIKSPNKVTAVEITPYSITVKDQGAEYKIVDENGKGIAGKNTYQSSTTFTDLTPGTTYKFYASGTDNSYSYYAGGYVSSISEGITTLGYPIEPITVESVTARKITIAQEPGKIYQYKINDGQWQDSNVFSGLKPSTTYNVYHRFSLENGGDGTAYATPLQVTTADLNAHELNINVITTSDVTADMVKVFENGEEIETSVNGDMITTLVERDANIKLAFNTVGDGEYIPIEIRYSGTKGKVLGESEYSFTAYGNQTNFDVKYALTEQTKLVKMFYTDVQGTKIYFDSFVDGADTVNNLENYPTLYNRQFDSFAIGNNTYLTAAAAATAIMNETDNVEVEVVYTQAASGSSGYSVAKHENMTVVNGRGQEIGATVEPLTLVTFTADKTTGAGDFSYWEDAYGNIVSYNNVYSRYIISDIDIYPVYGASTDKAVITASVLDNYGKLVVVAERSATEDITVVEHGVIIAEFDTDELTLDNVGVIDGKKIYLAHKVTNGDYSVINNGTYVVTKTDKASYGGAYSTQGTVLTFVAYVRYIDTDNEEHIVYSNISKSDITPENSDIVIEFDEVE